MASNTLMMRCVPAFLVLWIVAGCRAEQPSDSRAADVPSSQATETGLPKHAPELARRADSLAKLDPEREAREASARGDLRFIAVCGYACEPVGVPLDRALRTRDSLAFRGESLRSIVGTSDDIVNKDVAQLNEVATWYARRYNQVIWDRRAELQREARLSKRDDG